MILSTLQRLWTRITDRPVESDLHAYRQDLAGIREQLARLRSRSDSELAEEGETLAARAAAGTGLECLHVAAYALVAEAGRRAIGLEAHDEQILAGLALHKGRVVEQETGEGKTLSAVFPAFLHALTGHGVHVLTFNDYLAQRDADWMGPIYRLLGRTVAAVQQGQPVVARQAAYQADVTYATAREVGFDFLRDGLRTSNETRVHRPFHLAIVDEADSLLIDEARVPLVIAGVYEDHPTLPSAFPEVVRRLEPGVEFETDSEQRNVYLTDAGLDRSAVLLGCGPLHDAPNIPLLTGVNLALHAEVLLHRDVDYIVRDGRIEHVDEFTGRVVENRKWPDGLQAALEAKEGLSVAQEGSILGAITLQHLLKRYPRTCGMTATATPAAEELQELYGLKVTVIPPHRPCIRADRPDRIFASREAKETALVAEIRRIHQTRQPVLVGTRTVAESERIARALEQEDVPCQVLNARHDALEAELVAQAGALNAVTIATNMAGRGTDIRLGGTDQQDRAEVARLGGLHVIGTNRHESRRIDYQLRGRAGRQGDPGVSEFFISMQDDLFERFGAEGGQDGDAAAWPAADPMAPLTSKAATRAVAEAQQKIENQNLEIRRTLLKFTNLVEKQRLALRRRRDDVLNASDGLTLCQEAAPDRYDAIVSRHGEAVARNIEAQITLYQLDRSWADHLARVADLREGIHLHAMAGPNPFFVNEDPVDVFQRQVAQAFGERLDLMERDIVASFRTAVVTPEGLDHAASGLKSPGATWTYQINEHPFGNRFGLFFHGLKRLIRRK